MLTVDTLTIRAAADRCFHAAADVERWPDLLAHYRWVRFRRKEGFGTGTVEMAARREFGPVPYPVWWVSEMRVDPDRPAVIYRHVEGITTGMDVEWTFAPVDGGGTEVKIVHAWDHGPRWPVPLVARRAIADAVIGPVFIRNVAGRTLAGIKRYLEADGEERDS